MKFNDCFVVENFKILQGEKGIYAGMPSQPDRNGGYRDVAKPITKEFRSQLNEAVVEAYTTELDHLQARLAAARGRPGTALHQGTAHRRGKTGGTGAGGETRKGKGQPRAGQITSGHGGPKLSGRLLCGQGPFPFHGGLSSGLPCPPVVGVILSDGLVDVFLKFFLILDTVRDFPQLFI